MKLIKIDRNGTKYYAGDGKCRKCGGLGGADQWTYTGWTCYRCGGSGLDPHPEIIKEYTPEYEAKLQARREKREAQRIAKKVAEFNEQFDDKLADMGFGTNRKIYVVKGNTYSIREELKEAGATYRRVLNWFFSEPNEKYDTFEVDYTECLDINAEYGSINWKEEDELDKIVQENTAKEIKSEYVGEVGQKLDVTVTLEHSAWYERASFRGYGTEIAYVHTFVDENGNQLVWKTSNGLSDKFSGRHLNLKGSIKEHKEYAGIKQTMLQRCKIAIIDEGN